MSTPGSTLLPITMSIVTLWIIKIPVAIAQITPDRTLGRESSVVTPNVNIRGINSDRIDGGAVRGNNLFHSFQEFNVEVERGVYFSNPDGITNILTRVTGENLSQILGTLGVLGNANLFLINPSGIVFGPNARLDVGGSFFATTAESLQFSNGFNYSSSNPQTPPLLTINIPIGLNFRNNSGNIINQSVAIDSEENPVGLQIQPGNTLAFIGNQINLEGGIITAPGGRVEFGAVSGEGTVEINPNFPLNLIYPTTLIRGDINLTNAAKVDVVAADGRGSIAVNANNISLFQDSILEAGIAPDSGAPNIQGGHIELNATDTITIAENSQVNNGLNIRAEGTAGNIMITTKSLDLINGGRLNSSKQGIGTGGNIIVNARDNISLGGEGSDGSFSGIFSEVLAGSAGQGGSIYITTNSLSLTNQSEISTSNFFGISDAGDINITANTINLDGTGGGTGIFSFVESIGNSGNININSNFLNLGRGSSISNTIDPFAKGDSGDININTNFLFLTANSTIDTSTFGIGNAGNINIFAQNNVSIDGEEIRDVPGIFSRVGTEAIGKSGTIRIEADLLSVTDGGIISTNTRGEGNAGNILINVRDNISLDGEGILPTRVESSTGDIDNNSEETEEIRGNSGNVRILTNTLSITNGAQIVASTNRLGNGGTVEILARDHVILDGVGNSNIGGVFSTISENGVGDGGDVILSTGSLFINNGANISSSVFGQGNAGNIVINAPDTVIIDGANLNQIIPFGSAIATRIASDGEGTGGDIQITTNSLSITNGAELNTSTSGLGNAGNIFLNIGDRITVDRSRVISRVAPDQIITFEFDFLEGTVIEEGNPIGNGGNIEISTGVLSLSNNAELSANTDGIGDAGKIDIKATEGVIIAENSQISSAVEVNSVGNSQQILIQTPELILRDNAQISAATNSQGNAGTIRILDAENVSLNNSSISTKIESEGEASQPSNIEIETRTLQLTNNSIIAASTASQGNSGSIVISNSDIVDFENSTISTAVESSGIGEGGDIQLTTNNLQLDQTQITASTSGQGSSGIIQIQGNNITLTNNSSISTAVEPEAVTPDPLIVGNINIETQSLQLSNNSQITVSSQGEGAAGNLTVNADFVELNQSNLQAETVAGNGNIILNTQDLRSRRNSQITTNATGEATGGNIEMNTNLLVALENSDISANAEQAFGGRIIINANAIFGTQFRNFQTLASDITATSELGAQFSGTVELNSEVDPSQGLVEFPQTLVDPAALIAQDPCLKVRESQFIITGRGGIPTTPNDPLNANKVEVNLVNPSSSSALNNPTLRPSSEKPDQPVSSLDIIPARGWIRTQNGDVILVGYDPTKTGVQRLPTTFKQCQP